MPPLTWPGGWPLGSARLQLTRDSHWFHLAAVSICVRAESASALRFATEASSRRQPRLMPPAHLGRRLCHARVPHLEGAGVRGAAQVVAEQHRAHAAALAVAAL